jgi:2',3'-cyclic-nucleotide 2'-phosphodiesterase
MKILFFGDIVGKLGRKAVAKALPGLREKYSPDFVIGNGENLAHGKGVTEKTLDEIYAAGVDFLTSGNHVTKKEGTEYLLDREKRLIRPANYPPNVPGRGYEIVKIGNKKAIIINLVGRVFFQEDFDCPFRKLDELLEIREIKKSDLILVDFHAEATSEKVAFGWYADGRVTAIFGTHTHVPTADNWVLPKGSGYVTDVGRVAAKDSVLGVEKDLVIEKFLTQIQVRFERPEAGLVAVDAVLLTIDDKTNRAVKVERVDSEVRI